MRVRKEAAAGAAGLRAGRPAWRAGRAGGLAGWRAGGRAFDLGECDERGFRRRTPLKGSTPYSLTHSSVQGHHLSRGFPLSRPLRRLPGGQEARQTANTATISFSHSIQAALLRGIRAFTRGAVRSQGSRPKRRGCRVPSAKCQQQRERERERERVGGGKAKAQEGIPRVCMNVCLRLILRCVAC